MQGSDEQAAFEVARHLVEYGGYSGSRHTAIRALKRRLRDDDRGRVERMLDAAIGLLAAARSVVAENEASMWRAWEPSTLQLGAHDLGERLQRAVPQFSRDICDVAVAWVFYQHYLR